MKRPKTWQIILMAVAAIIVLSADSCGSSPDQKDRDATMRQFDIYTNSQPIHTYNFSMPRDVMIQIYDATMEAHNTWTVWYAYDHIPLDSCPSIGYPIPGGTQLTNPSRYAGNGTILPQGEPNGLFPPTTSQGTWVLCVRNGQKEPTYVEPNVVTYAHPVEVRDGKVVDLGGAATITVDVKSGGGPAPTAAPKAP